MKTIKELKFDLWILEHIENDPRVLAVKKLVREERKPQIDAINAQLESLRNKRPAKKPRWDENTPQHILETCSDFWQGTTEHATYRIHLWNDDFVWTSYPSGGYSDNGGWNPTPAAYHLISLKSKKWAKPAEVKSLTGRVTKDMMLDGFKTANDILKTKLT